MTGFLGMYRMTAILSALAVLSVAALVGGFAIQEAEASVALPRDPVRIGPITIGENDVRFDLRAASIIIGGNGVSIVPAPQK